MEFLFPHPLSLSLSFSRGRILVLNSTKEFPLHFIKFRNLHISFL